MLLFGYFQQDNYKIEFLAIRLEAIAVHFLIVYSVNVSLVVIGFS